MKKIAIMLAGLIATTLLAACGSKSNSSDIGNTNSGASEDVRLLWQDMHVAMGSQYSGVLVKNDMLYGYYMNNSGAMVAVQNTQSGDVVSETFVPDATNVQCIAADDQGNIFVLDGDRFWRIDFQFVDESGNIYPIEEPDAVVCATCQHQYVSGTVTKHVKDANGGCTVTKYEATKCTLCGNVVIGEEINSLHYKVCAH